MKIVCLLDLWPEGHWRKHLGVTVGPFSTDWVWDSLPALLC